MTVRLGFFRVFVHFVVVVGDVSVVNNVTCIHRQDL